MKIRKYQETDAEQVIGLWKACGLLVAWNNPYTDIERKVQHSPELFFVVESPGDSTELIGVMMVGYDGHRGTVNYLAVKPELQNSGLGQAMMGYAEEELIALGCPKTNLFVREGNEKVINFYNKLGFTPEKALAYGKRLIEDKPY